MILNLGERGGKSIIAIIAKIVIFILPLLNHHLKISLFRKINLITHFLSTRIQELFIFHLKKQLRLIFLRNSSLMTSLKKCVILLTNTRVNFLLRILPLEAIIDLKTGNPLRTKNYIFFLAILLFADCERKNKLRNY
jgi:hypothetical protein